MNFDERAAAVAKLGFTERQARFLTTVMLHTGVCVPRQYARYCRIVHGQKTRKFFAKLVRRGYASMYDCRHNRAQLYHLNKRSLYAAIGLATSRLQRPLPLSQAIHRLMVMDAIVEDPEMVWLGTAEDKTAHLTALTSITPDELPHVTSGNGERRTVRYFPDRLPIGIHLAGRGVLVYIVLDPTPGDFRLFLERHAAVLRALRAWTVRVVIPMHLQVITDLPQRVKQAFFTQLVVPAFSPARIDKVRQRFKDVRAQVYPFDFGPTDQYVEDRDYLAAPRYHVLFKVWKTEGDAALAGLASGAIQAAFESGAGQVETFELGHRYGHLAPLASVS
jgi:hypothetical protein